MDGMTHGEPVVGTGPERMVDIAVGHRIRELREHRRMTQAQLACRIGVSYQQVYKYERGMDRLSIGRLMMIAAALSVAPLDLIDGLPSAERRSTRPAQLPALERIRLMEAFADIPDPDVRERVQDLVRSLADAHWVPPQSQAGAPHAAA
jgi:transcriptional regulator with XRE-family HTH domain